MMSLTFGLFTQVSGSGPLGPLVVVMTYRGGFVLARIEVCGTFRSVQVYLIYQIHKIHLYLKLLYGCYMYSHGSKKYFCSKLIAT